MLEQIRKHHYVLMCIVAVVVVIAFAFLPDSRTGHAAGDKPVVVVNGQDLYRDDVHAINGQITMIRALQSMVDPQDFMARYTDPVFRYGSLPSRQGEPAGVMLTVVRRYNDNSRSDDRVDLDFVLNVTILREQAAELGVNVEREDLEKFVQTIASFQTAKKFDSAKYESFISGGAFGNREATEKRLYTMLRDVMMWQKLNSLIGGAYPPSPPLVDFAYASQHEVTTAWTVLVDKEKHPGEPVTDEDIQKFYDAEKDKKAAEPSADSLEPAAPSPGPDATLMSAEQRTLHYATILAPEMPKPPVPPSPVDSTGLDEAAKTAKDAEFKKLQDEYNEAQKAYDAAQEKFKTDSQSQRKLAETFSNALNSEERGGKSFDDVAKECGVEVQTAGPAARTDLPADVTKDPGFVEAVFAAEKGNSMEPPVRLENGYGFFEVTDVNPPAVRPLNEVKAAISEKLKAERSDNALRAAADAARSKLVESLKSGKSITEAAAEAELTATALPAFSSSKPAKDVPHSAEASQQASNLDAGDVSQPLAVAEGQLLVYVEKKELPNDPKMDEQKKALAGQMTLGGDAPFAQPSPLFGAWFQARRNEAAEVRN